jgi:hypothetical protein
MKGSHLPWRRPLPRRGPAILASGQISWRGTSQISASHLPRDGPGEKTLDSRPSRRAHQQRTPSQALLLPRHAPDLAYKRIQSMWPWSVGSGRMCTTQGQRGVDPTGPSLKIAEAWLGATPRRSGCQRSLACKSMELLSGKLSACGNSGRLFLRGKGVRGGRWCGPCRRRPCRSDAPLCVAEHIVRFPHAPASRAGHGV